MWIASWPAANPPIPANAIWHNETWPLIPVIRVIDKKMTEKTIPTPKIPNTQLGGNHVSVEITNATTSARHPHFVGISRRLSRICEAGGGGGGSTDASGSELCSMLLRLLLKSRTPARRMKGNACWRKLDARLLELGRASVRMFWTIPIATPATKATGMLLRLAMAAAVMPATSSVVKLRVFVGSSGFWIGRSRTPERPARTLESAHAPAATPDAFTPSSWESRLDSTTARIFRPTDRPFEYGHQCEDDHHGQDRVRDLPAVYRVTRRVEEDGVGVEPEKAHVVAGRGTEDDRNGLRYRDQQTEGRHELHRRRRGRDMSEEEAVERQTHERRYDEHRDEEAEPLVPVRSVLVEQVEGECRYERLRSERDVEYPGGAEGDD